MQLSIPPVIVSLQIQMMFGLVLCRGGGGAGGNLSRSLPNIENYNTDDDSKIIPGVIFRGVCLAAVLCRL